MSFDFDAARRERSAKRGPISFVLGGEQFTCVPVIPFHALGAVRDRALAAQDLVAAVAIDIEFVADCLADDDQRERWRALAERTEDPVDHFAFEEVGLWLVRQYLARPTSPSSDSSAGRSTTGAGSKGSRSQRSRGRKAA